MSSVIETKEYPQPPEEVLKALKRTLEVGPYFYHKDDLKGDGVEALAALWCGRMRFQANVKPAPNGSYLWVSFVQEGDWLNLQIYSRPELEKFISLFEDVLNDKEITIDLPRYAMRVHLITIAFFVASLLFMFIGSRLDPDEYSSMNCISSLAGVSIIITAYFVWLSLAYRGNKWRVGAGDQKDD